MREMAYYARDERDGIEYNTLSFKSQVVCLQLILAILNYFNLSIFIAFTIILNHLLDHTYLLIVQFLTYLV